MSKTGRVPNHVIRKKKKRGSERSISDHIKTKSNNGRWLTHVLPVDTSKQEEERKTGR